MKSLNEMMNEHNTNMNELNNSVREGMKKGYSGLIKSLLSASISSAGMIREVYSKNYNSPSMTYFSILYVGSLGIMLYYQKNIAKGKNQIKALETLDNIWNEQYSQNMQNDIFTPE